MTDIRAEDFQEVLAALAVELAAPMSGALSELVDLLRDPTPIVERGSMVVRCRSFSKIGTDGVFKVLDPDPTRIALQLHYKPDPGAAVYWWAPDDGLVPDGPQQIRVPSASSGASILTVPYSGAVWALADTPVSVPRQLQVVTFHR